MFVWAGGERDAQLTRSVEHGLRYFAREFALAVGNGATYVAPFSHELYLAQHGVEGVRLPSSRTAHAVLRSQLPIFRGLTPAVLAKLHQDDHFAAFREDLQRAYEHAPLDAGEAEVAAYLHDQEATLLQPRLAAAERSVDRGPLQKLGASLTGAWFSLAMGLAVDISAGTKGIATGLSALKTLGEKWRERDPEAGAGPVWTALVRHQRTISTELRGVELQSASAGLQDDSWSIPAQPSMSVTVSAGAAMADWLPGYGEQLPAPRQGYRHGDYRDCDCGSGRAFRWCCKGLRPQPPSTATRR